LYLHFLSIHFSKERLNRLPTLSNGIWNIGLDFVHKGPQAQACRSKDSDGGITFYVQNESPGKDKEANWLPSPKGPFAIYMRLYWPKADALNGKWAAPPLRAVAAK
jgi:hypothetical protein